MKVISLAQGSYRRLDGTPLAEALAQFKADDAEFLAHYPQCQPTFYPSWREREVPDTATAPWGYEWYTVDDAGCLQFHSAEYDTSG